MPFKPIGLSNELIGKLDAFLETNSFVDLYSNYNWKRDRFSNGFPDIFSLENNLLLSKNTTGIALSEVKCVAKWGGNHRKIIGPAIVLPKCALVGDDGVPNPELEIDPLRPLKQFANIELIGPTYYSKVLRFALPQEYGAIDTRLVRVFGQGDLAEHQWLTLFTKKSKRWSIPEAQRGWPSEYSKWINILRYFASKLENNCPHPQKFIDKGLRKKGVWECADVEMALFSYVSQQIKLRCKK